MSEEKYCSKCHKVWSGTKAECCGQPAEDFDSAVHGASLVSSSNAWLEIQDILEDHPLRREVIQELWDDGCYGAATHLRVFVDRLVASESALQSELTDLRALVGEAIELIEALHPVMNPDEPCVYYDWWLRAQRWKV